MIPSLLIALVTVQVTPQASAGLRLTEAGRTPFAIVVDRRATPPERHAAHELASFLERISGATFPIREVTEPPRNAEHMILVGPDAARGVISPAEIARLGQEGYVLRTRATTLAIAGGRPRGTLYGVYSFLEDSLGCRWFTPTVSRIPKQDRVTIPALDRTFAPRLEYRATDYPGSRDADWAARNKINGTQTQLDVSRGGKIAYGPFVHTFNSILDPKEHFRRHPEYFSEVNGQRVAERTQLCLSNPEVLRIATDTVRRWMREQPESTIFSVSQNDWYNYCTCKNCARITAEEGSPIGPYLRFVNAIADAVRDEFPGKTIDTLAYQFTRSPPKKVKPRPNVMVRLCDIECCFAHPLGVAVEVDKRNADFAGDLRRWSETTDRLYVWDYVVDFAHSIMPFPNLYTLKPNINFFVDHHVKGIYEEAAYFSKGTELAELRTWILAKTLWNPGYDTDRAIDEFLEGYYGQAAAPIRRYIDLVHGEARSGAIHFRIGERPSSTLFSDHLVARAAALFDQAEKQVTDQPAIRERVRVARLQIVYVQIAKCMKTLTRPGERSAANLHHLQSLFDMFDRVAHEEGVTQVSEGGPYEAWAARVKAVLAGGPADHRAESPVAAQLYVWTQFYGERRSRLEDHLDDVFAATKRAGFDAVQGFLTFYDTPEKAAKVAAKLKEHGLTMPAAYDGGAMHTRADGQKTLENIVRQARRGVPHGLRLVIHNPLPLNREKTDQELAVQAENLNRLGAALNELGIRLAVHSHEPEMRHGAREWYYMLRHTNPDQVGVCLDLHWVLRGGQDPCRLLQDAGKRVLDLHLRNSRGGVWSESLGDGDIDYGRIGAILKRIGYQGFYTVELAYESKTPHARSLAEDLQRSREYVQRVLGQ